MRTQQIEEGILKIPQIETQLETIMKVVRINVKDFGAKGDGVSDDTIAIQNALDYIYSIGGGEVYFPSGVYIISKLTDFKLVDGQGQLNYNTHTCLLVKGNNVKISGDGIGKTILKLYPSNYRDNKKMTGALSNMITLQCSLDEIPFKQSNIEINGIELNGGRGQWNEVVCPKNLLGENGTFDGVVYNSYTHFGKGILARTINGDLSDFKIKNVKVTSVYAEGTHSHKAKKHICL